MNGCEILKCDCYKEGKCTCQFDICVYQYEINANAKVLELQATITANKVEIDTLRLSVKNVALEKKRDLSKQAEHIEGLKKWINEFNDSNQDLENKLSLTQGYLATRDKEISGLKEFIESTDNSEAYQDFCNCNKPPQALKKKEPTVVLTATFTPNDECLPCCASQPHRKGGLKPADCDCRFPKEPQKTTLIYCKAVVCAYQDNGRCRAESVHLEGCTPDADNVFACSEFVEQALAQALGQKEPTETQRRDVELVKCERCGFLGCQCKVVTSDDMTKQVNQSFEDYNNGT